MNNYIVSIIRKMTTIEYIPVSLVSAIAGRNPYIPWKHGISMLLEKYYPAIWNEILCENGEEEQEEIILKGEKLQQYNEIIQATEITKELILNEKEYQLAIVDRGTLMEEDTISRLVYNEEMKSLYKNFKINRNVSVSGIFPYFKISGMMDGVIWNKCILEIKNRANRFLTEDQCSYDIDQLVMYIVLFTIPLSGRLIQQYNGQLQIGREITYKEAYSRWINEIKPKLEKHINIANKQLSIKNYSWFSQK